MNIFENQIYYWTHMLDEAFNKNIINENDDDDSQNINLDNAGITSLENLQKDKVNGDLIISNNDKLFSLDGMPSEIYGDLILDNCPNIKNLNVKTTVHGYIIANNCGLETLVGCPSCKGLDVKGNKKLTNLNGLWQQSYDKINCSNCGLTSLYGCPEQCEMLNVSGNKDLKSLQGCPRSLISLDCSNCNILALYDAPQSILGTFNISGNKNLTSLDGAPNYIGDKIITDNTGLTQRQIDRYCYYLTNAHLRSSTNARYFVLPNDDKYDRNTPFSHADKVKLIMRSMYGNGIKPITPKDDDYDDYDD